MNIGKKRNIGWKTNKLSKTRTSFVAQSVKNLPAVQETQVDPWVGKIPWRRERLPTPAFWPGEFHRLYSPWGHKESDMTEGFSLSVSILSSLLSTFFSSFLFTLYNGYTKLLSIL